MNELLTNQKETESGEGNSRLIEMKQNEMNERQNDKRQRSRAGCGVIARHDDSLPMSVQRFQPPLEGLWISCQS